MAKRISKKKKAIFKMVIKGQSYKFSDAVELLKSLPLAKFRKTAECVDVSVNLGVEPRKSDQIVRGSTLLPNGTGKTVRVAVFTQGINVEVAKKAGADIVGMSDLAEQIQAGNIDFDVVIATPDAMSAIGRLGPILGPRGLMPSPKVGTVSSNVAIAVQNAKAGQIRYKADKYGIVNCSIGKIDFEVKALQENLKALLANLLKVKPSTAKGIYFKKATLSTTMGPGLMLDLTSMSF